MAFQFNDNSSRKTFSEINNKLNFQTENMVHKIKTVHKKKKKFNYKNIEQLENIHDTNDDSSPEREPIIEGLAVLPVATFSDDDWTKEDDVYEGGGKASTPTTNFSSGNIIDIIYESVNNVTTKIAEIIVKVFSGKTHNEADIPIIKKYICWSLSIVAASIAVLNWVFLMFYKEYNERVELYDISRDRLYNAGIMNKFYALLDFLFDIPMFFPEKLQTVFVKDGPEFVSNYVNITICYTLIFAGLIRFFYNSASSMRKLLNDIIGFNMSNPILSFMYGTTFLLYILSFFMVEPISAAFNMTKIAAGFPASLLMPFISNLIKIFVLMMFAVPFAATFCILYIFIFSFFGIPLLSDYGFVETISKLYKYLNKHTIPLKTDTVCNPLSIFGQILNSIATIFNIIYKCALPLSVIAMLIYGIVDYAINIKGSILKLVLLLLNSILIVVFGINAFYAYNAEYPDDEDDNNSNVDVPSKTSEPTLNESIAEDTAAIASWIASKTLPDLNDIKNKLPGLSYIKNKISDLSDIKNKLSNDLSDIKNKIPDLTGITNKLSKLDNIAINFNAQNNNSKSLAPSLQLSSNATQNISGIIPGVNAY